MVCKKCGTTYDQLSACPACGEPAVTKKDPSKLIKLIVTGVCILLLVAVLTVVILMNVKPELFQKSDKKVAKEPAKTPTAMPSESVTLPLADDTTAETQEQTEEPAKSYAVDAQTAQASMEQVVATAGNYELTNGQFQIYYWFQVYMHYENYADYIDSGVMELDPKKPLSEQPCTENPSISWEQFFVNKAIVLWQSYAALNTQADAQGFELSQELVEKIRSDVLLEAQNAGYETADAFLENMLAEEVGPGTNVEQYWKYQEFVNRATSYYTTFYDGAEPTMEEMEAYYTENAALLESYGYGKDAGSLVDVRHILVMVEQDNDAGWKAAQAEATRIQNEWIAGGGTEELFAELANKYSEDGGSNTAGGLYTNVYQGQMVESFNDWIFDESRKYGDSAILKADYHYMGYHIMYFVDSHVIWETVVKQELINEHVKEKLSECINTYPVEQQEENLKIGQPYA